MQIVAVIYNYSGITYEAFEGGTLDSVNAQYELEYVDNILFKSYEAINEIVSTVDDGHPVYAILYPHLLCYDYFMDYTSALYVYFGDPTDANFNAAYEARKAAEPYMSDIGLIIENRGE